MSCAVRGNLAEFRAVLLLLLLLPLLLLLVDHVMEVMVVGMVVCSRDI